MSERVRNTRKTSRSVGSLIFPARATVDVELTTEMREAVAATPGLVLADQDEASGQQAPQEPPRNGTTQEWLAYAQSLTPEGDHEALAELGRDELVALFATDDG